MFINQILTKLKSLVYSKSETDSLLNGKASSSHTHTKSQITDFPTIPTVNNATLTIQKNGSNVATFTANASSNVTANITVPTVNNATLTIQKNGTNVATFTSNASSNVTANISVPTNNNELTNGSGFITSEIDSSGTGWVRFKCGIQICYGGVNNLNGLGTGLTRFSFPKAFNAKPNITVTPNISARYAGTALVEGSTTWVLNNLALYCDPVDYVPDPAAYNFIAVGTWK